MPGVGCAVHRRAAVQPRMKDHAWQLRINGRKVRFDLRLAGGALLTKLPKCRQMTLSIPTS